MALTPVLVNLEVDRLVGDDVQPGVSSQPLVRLLHGAGEGVKADVRPAPERSRPVDHGRHKVDASCDE